MSLRIILTSARALDVVIAALAGVALALAFPKTNLAWIAPLGAAALFWLWENTSWKRAALLGWFAGTVFFALSFSWFGYTVGAYLGPWSPLVVAGPAIVEGAFIALAGIAASFAFRYAPKPLAPLAAAAAFPVFECLRSIGWTAVPFGQLGYSQAGTPLALFAAYAGTYGVTFAICILGAYLADALRTRTTTRFLVTITTLAVLWLLCWFAWPARHIITTERLRVAAIQGNIAQSLKWTPSAIPLAINRYITMTRNTAPIHPQLVVWPETVIPELLNTDPRTESRLATLAKSLHATLIAGAQEYTPSGTYNALYIFDPNGNLENVYQKRQLVPFAESLPAKKYLNWLPYINSLAGTFANGTTDGVYPANTMRFGPMICWESAFTDLAHNQLQNGAQFFVIITDDAWFGDTAGPYMHAQIAQLRAIETGTWIVRSAATGISGIIAPTGQYIEKTQMNTQAIVTGTIGAPPGSLYARLGPTPIIVTISLLYLVLLIPATRLQQRHQWFGKRLTTERSPGGRE